MVRVTASPSVHTFRITKTDNTALQVYADCFLIPGTNTAPVAFFIDPSINAVPATGPFAIARNKAIVDANKVLIDAVVVATVPEFPMVNLLNANLLAPDQSTVDKLHPTDRGMPKIAKTVAAWASAKNLNGQYKVL